ncbi:MAG: PHB depolymerase family esterase, partial [Caldimonas sp.]
MNPILQKILAATGLTRHGELAKATTAIQQALAEARIGTAPREPQVEAPTSSTTAATDVLDGWVREIDVLPVENLKGGFNESTFTAEAGTRSFKLFEPAGFEGRALPLVVMLHGCTQSPDDFAAGTRMNALAQEQGLYVLYPAQAP